MNTLQSLVLLTLLVSLSANSQEIEKDYWESKRIMCDKVTQVARHLMESRQQGVPIEDLYEKLSGMDIRARAPSERLINEIYKAPIIPPGPVAEKAKLEFTNQFFKACMK